METKPQFRTTAAYLSGGICGRMWMPAAMAGKPIKLNARGAWGFMDAFSEHAGTSWRDALLHILMAEGGDFQNALFTADTEIVIERRRIDAPGKYTMHIRRLDVGALAPDLVDPEAYVGDFMGDCE